jgi:hypothetical protein
MKASEVAWTMLEQDEAAIGHGRLAITKSGKGADGHTTIRLKTRTLYFIQRYFEESLGSEGSWVEKRAITLWLEELRQTVAEANKLRARAEMLRRNGIKPTPELVAG